MTQEKWKPVVGWETLYEVSDKGHVRSLDRVVQEGPRAGWRYKGKMLKWLRHNMGYWCVCLSRHGDKGKHLVHRLVYSAFKEPLPDDVNLDHKDRNRLNPELGNLRIASQSDNLSNNGSEGVYFHKKSRKWMARIQKHRRTHYLGIFTDREEALKVRRAAEKSMLGEFAPTNRTRSEPSERCEKCLRFVAVSRQKTHKKTCKPFHLRTKP